jgi:hypothetical protein
VGISPLVVQCVVRLPASNFVVRPGTWVTNQAGHSSSLARALGAVRQAAAVLPARSELLLMRELAERVGAKKAHQRIAKVILRSHLPTGSVIPFACSRLGGDHAYDP